LGDDDTMVILPSDFAKFSILEKEFGKASIYPIIVKASQPMMQKQLGWLKEYGYITARGKGFVELTKELAEQLTDMSLDNGTINGRKIGVDENGKKIFRLVVDRLTVNGVKYNNAAIEFGLKRDKVFENKFSVITGANDVVNNEEWWGFFDVNRNPREV